MRHLVVISEDAMVFEDLQTLRELPEFGALWGRMARVERVRSIYPTITYPCHATMMTGVYPATHGIVNNEQPILCERGSKWQHFREAVHAPTIFDAAKAAGMTTAAVFWPLTGGDPAIDYLVDEYWSQTPDETAADCFRHSGTSEDVMRRAVLPNLPLMEGRQRVHPYCDDFIFACACSIIRAYKPDLMMIHPANIDGYRHETGLFTPRVTHGLHEADHWLGQVLKACEDAGTLDDTDFFIVSDHGQLNITRVVAPNVALAERGLIDVDAAGEITGFRAFAKSGGMSSLVYLRDPNDRAAWAETYAALCFLRDEGVYGISRVFTREEAAREEHLDGAFSFVLETDGCTSFSSDWRRPIVKPVDNADYRFGRATHGHLPDKGPQPTLLAFGPRIRAGRVLPNARLVDEAPTFARALGLEMTGVDGTALDLFV